MPITAADFTAAVKEKELLLTQEVDVWLAMIKNEWVDGERRFKLDDQFSPLQYELVTKILISKGFQAHIEDNRNSSILVLDVKNPPLFRKPGETEVNFWKE